MQTPKQTPTADVTQLFASLAALPNEKIDSLVELLGKLRRPPTTAPSPVVTLRKPLPVAKRLESPAVAPVVVKTHPVFKSVAPPAVHVAPPTPSNVDATITLSQFFEQWFKPVLLRQRRKVNEKTVRLYEQSVAHWERLAGDPPLATVTDETLAAFVAALEPLRGRRSLTLSAHTVRKHCVNIQSILYAAGPPRPGIKHCRGVIAHTPQFGTIRLPATGCQREFTLAEFAALWRIAPQMDRPLVADATPGQWWRGFLALFYFGAVRIHSGLMLTFADVQEDGWTRIPDEHAKRRNGYRFYLPQRALAAIAFGDPRRERVLPLVTDGKWEHAVGNLRNRFNRMQRMIGIPRYQARGFHGLRKLAATELAKIDPLAAKLQLGHRGDSILEQHYLSRGVLVDVVNRMPWPIEEDAA